MKIGMRTPSLKKSLKARTTSKWKRQAKRALIPGYGQKGVGWIKNPKKALYNKVYHKTTFGLSDLLKPSKKRKKKATKEQTSIKSTKKYTAKDHKEAGIVLIVIGAILVFLLPPISFIFITTGFISFIIGHFSMKREMKKRQNQKDV